MSERFQRALTASPVARAARDAGPWILAGLSGLCVFASFEPWRASNLAFVALIPWLFALRLRPDRAAGLSLAGGLVCWIPGVWFVSPVTVPGALALGMYCALYWLPAGVLWGRMLRVWEPERPVLALRFVVGGAAFWSLLEWVRGWFLTGFPWNGLGISQSKNLPLAQLASLGGVELISFVVAAVNFGVALSLMSLAMNLKKRRARRMHPELYAPILLLVVSTSWGTRELRGLRTVPVDVLRVAVVQPAIEVKWEKESADDIRRILWELSEIALMDKPDLLLWPETVLPDELRYSPESWHLVTQLVNTHGVPILLGTLDFMPVGDDLEDRHFFNAAMLVGPEGILLEKYWKRHLVMFGEYIPFSRVFPFLRSLTPMPEDITPGTEPGVFELPAQEMRAGILICFEDLMPYLSRDLVAEEVDLFVNLTNDGWFDPWWGSLAHLDHALFRSIEQRRPTVRATNTGVSAWIDHRGVVRERLEHGEDGHRARWFKTFHVDVPREPLPSTFFHRHPSLFAMLFALLSLLQPFIPPRRPCC